MSEHGYRSCGLPSINTLDNKTRKKPPCNLIVESGQRSTLKQWVVGCPHQGICALGARLSGKSHRTSPSGRVEQGLLWEHLGEAIFPFAPGPWATRISQPEQLKGQTPIQAGHGGRHSWRTDGHSGNSDGFRDLASVEHPHLGLIPCPHTPPPLKVPFSSHFLGSVLQFTLTLFDLDTVRGARATGG